MSRNVHVIHASIVKCQEVCVRLRVLMSSNTILAALSSPWIHFINVSS